MQICTYVVDKRTDGSMPVQCDVRIEGITMIISLPEVDMDLVMLTRDVEQLLLEDIDGSQSGKEI